MPETTQQFEEVSTSRLETFSDGVFAIAITLLILQLKLPQYKILGDEGLKSYLLKQWPEYFAYVLSFLMIGTYWANHHYIFRFYAKTDHFFLILNTFFLMSVSFLPFPTAILGEYINNLEHKGSSVTFYSLGLFLPAFFWYLMWLYANHNKRLVDEMLTSRFRRYLTVLYSFSTFLYLFSVFVSLYFPLASIIISIVLTLLFMLPPRKPEYKNA